MTFSVKQVKEFYLLDTKLENIFINEFMTAAPGDYVKVYLLSLMYAGAGIETDNAKIAKQLMLEEEDVLKAWNYWENLGAVKKKYRDKSDKFRYDVEFLCIREKLYGNKSGEKEDEETRLPQLLNDKELQKLYNDIERVTGRILGGKEPVEIASWISEFGASPGVITFAYSYCVTNRKKDNYKYVGSFVKERTEKGLLTVPEIESYLQEVDERHFLYKRILKSMGFTRNATEEEKRLMDSWFDEMGFTADKVLEACGKTSGISNPNFNYVNKILVNWHSGACGEKKRKKPISVADVHRYYDKIRKQAEGEANEKKEQIYLQIPEIKEIDEELRLCGMEMSKIIISGGRDKKQLAGKYKNKSEQLSKRKAALLKENDYSAGCMETQYRCEICRDSGVDDNGERCGCFKEIQKEAEAWLISSKR